MRLAEFGGLREKFGGLTVAGPVAFECAFEFAVFADPGVAQIVGA